MKKTAGLQPRIVHLKGKGYIPDDFTAYAIIFNIPTRHALGEYNVSLIVSGKEYVQGNLLGIRNGEIYPIPETSFRKSDEFAVYPADVDMYLIGQHGYKKTNGMYITGIVADGGKITRARFKVPHGKIFRLYDILTRGLAWDDVSTSTVLRSMSFSIMYDAKTIAENIPYNSRIFMRDHYFIFEPFDIKDYIEFYAGSELERFHYTFVLIGELIDRHIEKGGIKHADAVK